MIAPDPMATEPDHPEITTVRRMLLRVLPEGTKVPPDTWFQRSNYAEPWSQLPPGTILRVVVPAADRPGMGNCVLVGTTRDPLRSFTVPSHWFHTGHFEVVLGPR